MDAEAIEGNTTFIFMVEVSMLKQEGPKYVIQHKYLSQKHNFEKRQQEVLE